MINFWQAGILGVVQGITEFLPVSSTGHLILSSQLLGLISGDFLTSFIIVIQAGSILAVLFLYGKSLLNWEFDKKIIAAFLPTAIVGFLIYKIVKTVFLGNNLVVAVALILGGLLMIYLERFYNSKKDFVPRELSTLTYREAMLIGLVQALAMIPGVSRSAATLFGGLAVGLSRSATLEFSFLLAIPTMLAATGYDLFKSGSAFSLDQVEVIIFGIVLSFVVSMISIRWLLNFVRQHTFVGFGIYRIVLGTGWLLFFWLI